jgi:hypothetical protein
MTRSRKLADLRASYEFIHEDMLFASEDGSAKWSSDKAAMRMLIDWLG